MVICCILIIYSILIYIIYIFYINYIYIYILIFKIKIYTYILYVLERCLDSAMTWGLSTYTEFRQFLVENWSCWELPGSRFEVAGCGWFVWLALCCDFSFTPGSSCSQELCWHQELTRVCLGTALCPALSISVSFPQLPFESAQSWALQGQCSIPGKCWAPQFKTSCRMRPKTLR